MQIDKPHKSSSSIIKTRSGAFKLNKLSVVMLNLMLANGFYFLCSHPASAEYFDPALLSVGENTNISADSVDLSAFEAGSQAPGTYLVSLFVNNSYVDDREVVFIADDKSQLIPQFTVAQYRELGLRVKAIPALNSFTDDELIGDLRQYVPETVYHYDFASQKYSISFPQMLTRTRIAGEVNPASWNQGLPAAMLNYTVTGNQTRNLKYAKGRSDSLYANLRSGLNLGAWRLRNYSTYQQQNAEGQNRVNKLNVISTYLQRDVHAIQGQLTLGESATPGDVFDSVQFRGAQLASDDSMLPDSLRGFAPVIRGESQSGAEITIRQNGSTIYQSYVPPGPFEITDLYPTSLSGDLIVTVKESDGSERSFTQPYSSIAIMQREGQLKYAVTAGRLSSGSTAAEEPFFVQGTLIYGLPGGVTAYGGLQLAEKFQAATVGTGIGLAKLGALSADVTHSDAVLPNGDKSQGQSYRLRYSRSQVETGTTLSLAAYRYSTEGYYSFQDAFTDPENGARGSQYRPRGEFQAVLSQTLGALGSIYLSASQRDFWNKEGKLHSWNVGYNGSLYGVSYGVNFSQSRDTESGKEDRRVAVSASVPLGRWLAGDDRSKLNNMRASMGMTSSQSGGDRYRTGLTGAALDDNRLSYSLSQSQGDNDRSGSLSAAYRGSAGSLSAGYNHSPNQSQINYGLSGSIVAHPYGITLGQELGESATLIRAPGASGMKVNNQSALETDWFGNALVSSTQPYRRTEISVDPKGLSARVALDETSRSVVPTRGALVLADFPTQRGHQVMMSLLQASGAAVPFGASARLIKKDGEPNTGIVGSEGLLYISGMPDSGTLEVQWGKGKESQCQVAFDLQAAAASQPDGVPLQVKNVCNKI